MTSQFGITGINFVEAEQKAFEKEVAQVKEWWTGERFKNVKRPYSPEDVVSKRGTLKLNYPSDDQAKKLWKVCSSSLPPAPYPVLYFLRLPGDHTKENDLLLYVRPKIK